MRSLSYLIQLLFTCFLVSSCASRPTVHDSKINEKNESFPIGWVELGPNSTAIARVITKTTNCPKIKVDSDLQSMRVRAQPSPVFPVLSCEYEIPSYVRILEVEGMTLPVPKANPKRVVVIGDTGCRIKVTPSGESIQDCNNPEAWPYEKIAQKAAEMKPDLVIHLGDYLYRESECPKGRTECSGTPYGDGWNTWNLDFFYPSKKLFSAAPWVMVRGNHELCKRGGEGWFRFLEPRKSQELACDDGLDPYWITLGSTQLVVMDAADADDNEVIPEQKRKFEYQLKKIRQFPLNNAWLLVHRPFWALVSGRGSFKQETSFLKSQAVLSAAAKTSGFAPSLKLIFAGHVHVFEALMFDDKGPSEFIVGNSGTSLDTVQPLLDGKTAGSRRLKSSLVSNGFGFMVLDRNRSSWTGSLYNVEGEPVHQCQIQSSKLTCK